MKITLIIPGLECGGAERVMTQMANYWSDKKWDISIITFQPHGKAPFYELDQRVKLSNLNLYDISGNILKGILNNIKRLHTIRRAVRRINPDVVISFIDVCNVVVIASLIGTGYPLIVSERINPFMHNIGRKWDILRKIFYRSTSKVVIQTEEVSQFFSKPIQKKCFVIPNPIRQIPQPLTEDEKDESKRIIAMGRLVNQKGFDSLIREFKTVNKAYPDWNLFIFGEGPERKNLQDLINKLNLGKSVFMPGIVNEPYHELMKADIFVLSSRYEGFPNVLCEAMACGLPVISTNCPNGPGTIIKHEVNGILVPVDEEGGLSKAMIDLISHKNKRDNLSSNAKLIINQYSLDAVMSTWEKNIEEVCHENCVFN